MQHITLKHNSNSNCAMGVFCSSKHQLLPSKALLWVPSARPNAPSVRQRQGHDGPPGAWVNTGQCSQHKRHTGLCNTAVGHLATSQHSVPALWATTAVTLRIEVAGANPMACCRNADCGKRRMKTWKEARERKKEKRSVCRKNGKMEAKSERTLRKSRPGIKRLRTRYLASRELCPYKLIVCVMKRTQASLISQGHSISMFVYH